MVVTCYACVAFRKLKEKRKEKKEGKKEGTGKEERRIRRRRRRRSRSSRSKKKKKEQKEQGQEEEVARRSHATRGQEFLTPAPRPSVVMLPLGTGATVRCARLAVWRG